VRVFASKGSVERKWNHLRIPTNKTNLILQGVQKRHALAEWHHPSYKKPISIYIYGGGGQKKFILKDWQL